MKKFRVYLKEGRHIDVVADHFTFKVLEGDVTFFKSKDEKDTDILIGPHQTVAIVPLTKEREEPTSSSVRMY